MSLTLDPKIDLSDAVVIKIGGVELQVARLMLRQTSKIGPWLPDVLRVLNRRGAATGGIPVDENGVMVLTAEASIALMSRLALTDVETDMALRVILIGLSRAYPKVTLDDLLDLPGTTADLADALNAVVVQTGATTKAGDPGVGEAKAATL